MNLSPYVYFLVGAGMNLIAQLSQSVATMVENGNSLHQLSWADFGEVQLFILIFGAIVQAAHSAYGRFSRDQYVVPKYPNPAKPPVPQRRVNDV